MKRKGYVIEKVADPDNLRLAFWKAKRGKQGKPSVLAFQKNLNVELHLLRKEILNGKVQVGNYHFFKIYDPKEREICAAAFRERVLHHALMNICHEDFERYQIYDSYASRKGKGTYAAIDRAKVFTKRYQWYLKLDVRKFFFSIHQEVLKAQLHRLYKDARLLHIFYDIIDSYDITSPRGLPIGNLTSQYFANHYLALADHFVKEEVRIPAYVRYMDDMVLWSNDKAELLEKGRIFKEYIQEQLRLELKPFCLNCTTYGLSFLGYRIFKNNMKLNKRSANCFKNKIVCYEKMLEEGSWTQKDYQRHVEPLTIGGFYAKG